MTSICNKIKDFFINLKCFFSNCCVEEPIVTPIKKISSKGDIKIIEILEINTSPS